MMKQTPDTIKVSGVRLAPCPHCGNKTPVARRYRGIDGFRDTYAILCDYSLGGCGAEGGHYHTVAEAVANWNDRAKSSDFGVVQLKFKDEIDLSKYRTEVDWTAWKSPINMITSDLMSEIHRVIEDEQEKFLFEACRNVGFDIDKEELAKALNYDRDSYKKGYETGYQKAKSELWIKAIDSLPEDGQEVFIYDSFDRYHVGYYEAEKREFDCDTYSISLDDEIRWMPCTPPAE